MEEPGLGEALALAVPVGCLVGLFQLALALEADKEPTLLLVAL